MSEIPWISSTNLPSPAKLDAPWFERLGLSEQHRHHYTHLDQHEVALLEAARVVAHRYEEAGIRQDGKTTAGLIRRLGEEFDRHWLKPGFGRTVDFKSVLETLEAYAVYRDWVAKHKFSGIHLHFHQYVLIPYWMNPFGREEDAHHGSGVLRVSSQVRDSCFGKLGEFGWNTIRIDLSESFTKRNWKKGSRINPIPLVVPNMTSSKKTGLLHWIAPSIREGLIGTDGTKPWISNPKKRILRNINSEDYSPEIKILHPTAAEVQTIYDSISWFAHQQAFPIKPRHQIRFEVAPDLSKIDVSYIKTDRWLPRAELPPLPSPP